MHPDRFKKRGRPRKSAPAETAKAKGPANRAHTPKIVPAYPKKYDHPTKRPRGRPRIHNVPPPPEFYRATRPIPGFRAVPLDMVRAKKLAIIAVRTHGVLVEACRASGIGRMVMTQLMRDDKEFRLEMSAARKDRLEEIERSMFERGSYPRGDTMSTFALTHNTRRYREVSRVELTGKDGEPIALESVKASILERLSKLTASLAADAEIVPAAVGESGGRLGLVKPEGPTVRKVTEGRAVKDSRR